MSISTVSHICGKYLQEISSSDNDYVVVRVILNTVTHEFTE